MLSLADHQSVTVFDNGQAQVVCPRCGYIYEGNRGSLYTRLKRSGDFGLMCEDCRWYVRYHNG